MTDTDLYLKRVFASGVQVAFVRHRNLRDLLCRATLYTPTNINDRTTRNLSAGNDAMTVQHVITRATGRGRIGPRTSKTLITQNHLIGTS